MCGETGENPGSQGVGVRVLGLTWSVCPLWGARVALVRNVSYGRSWSQVPSIYAVHAYVRSLPIQLHSTPRTGSPSCYRHLRRVGHVAVARFL